MTKRFHTPYLQLLAAGYLLAATCVFAADSDGDGVDDSIDKFPADRVAWEDTDNDGQPDSYVLASAGDGFESGNLTAFGWATSSSYPWTTTTSYKIEGARGAISSATTTPNSSYIEKTYTASGGQLVYWVRAVTSGFISCSGGGGGGGYGGSGGTGSGSLSVMVDGVAIRFIPCSTTWQKLSIPLSAGTHTYRFFVPASCTSSFCSATVRWALDDVKFYNTLLVEDTNDDNDAYLDTVDAFPKDPSEWADNDTDGVGNNADTDDDNDSVADVSDNCPLLANVDQLDIDSDGLGYTCDSDMDGDGTVNSSDADDDNDGVADTTDTFPFDPSRSAPDTGVLYSFYGHNGSDYFSYSLSEAGDVNGDSYDDVIIGAKEDDNTGLNSGSATVLSGATGERLYQFNGPANGIDSDFGFSVSSAGDIDGDGYPDLIVGAHRDSDGINTEVGSVWRYSGATGASLSFDYGSSANDYYGVSVSGVGDVNQDGYDDYAVGAAQDELTTGDMGCARVYSGLDNAQLFVFCGQNNNDYFGRWVSAAGDVNNDGYPDIMVGAHLDDTVDANAGKAVVFSGQNGAALHTWFGKKASDNFGWSISGAGDVNNDGYDDVIVGLEHEDFNGASGVGAARVYSGKTGKILYTWYGDYADDRLGQSVSGAGDLNDDGYADLIVGTPGDDNAGSNSGSATVFSGQNGSILYVMNGSNANANFGYAVSAAGDVNADGTPDFMVGGFGGNVNGSNSGIARIYSGKAMLVDSDGDGSNDAVDADDDNDAVLDMADDYPLDATKSSDPDGDRIDSSVDNCDNIFNLDQADVEGDGIGDICDNDDDNDGEFDTTDKWPLNRAIALDADNDSFADAWTLVCDLACQTASGLVIDNCPSISNIDQLNTDGDTQGNACDADDDNDGTNDPGDLFPLDGTRWLGETGILYTFFGDSANDQFGYSASAAGDVNGDGYDDVIVGAYGDNNSGSARIFSGLDGSILHALTGDNAGDNFGYSVSAAGDINKDGYGDVIVGAFGDDNTGEDSGSARILSGLDGTTIFLLNGSHANDWFGSSVSGAGDVNADGYADVIVGAPEEDPAGASSGSARVFSGLDGSILRTFYGDSVDDRLGHSVSGAGDVNNDGYDDLVVGAPYDDPAGKPDAGRVSVYSGIDGALLYSYVGTSTNEYFGYSVSNAGDVNADNYADVIIGAYNNDSSGTNAGMARIYSGQDGTVLYTFLGDSANDNLGISVAGVGDINGDGYGDVLVGASGDDNENHGASGSARVYSGQDGGIIYGFNGDGSNNVFGMTVQAAGDVNNDGYLDVVVAAPDNAHNGARSGSVRVFSGKAKWMDTDSDGLHDALDANDDGDDIDDIYDAYPLDPTKVGDFDQDGTEDLLDNCLLVANPDQLDTDSDDQGNACDADDDNDGYVDTQDSFPIDAAAALDLDFDGMPDEWSAGCDATCQSGTALILDADDDNDSVPDVDDAFPLQAEASADTDDDGLPDSISSRVEGFETGDFSQFSWHMAASQPWTVTSTALHSGVYSARSGVIGNSQVSSMEITVYTGSQISFALRINNLNSDNRFVFYVDGVQSLSSTGAGNSSWTVWPRTVTPGRHTLTWSYIRGPGSSASGDVVFIDNIDLGTTLTEDVDDDNDGVDDAVDAFPLDPAETVDADNDGVGNNTDTDDDNDGMPDAWELQYGFNSLVNDANGDADGDDISNLQEYQQGTDPTVVDISVPYDFDNDGDADILLRNTVTGQNVIWLLENGAKAATSTLTTNALTFDVAAILDGDHDGDADILWYDAAQGKLIFWQMQNGVKAGNAFLGNTTATLDGLGDFDGDGDTDILLKTLAGDVKIWTLENMTHVLTGNIGTPPAGYAVIDTGDFNNDGIDDIVMQNGSGAVRIWQLNSSAQLASAIDVATIDLSYSLKKSGDTDSDGDDDLVFRNDSTGQSIVWEMENGARVSAHVISGLNPSMNLVAVTDFDQDGDEDLLFRDTAAGDASDGNTILWKMQGNSKEANSFLGNNAVTFLLESTLDMDGDGDNDILYRDTGTGQILGWNMQGGAKAGNYNLGNTSTNWVLRF